MDEDNGTLFSRWSNIPLLGSLFEGDKRVRHAYRHPARDDIPLENLQQRLIDEELEWEAADLDDDTPPLTPALSSNSIGKLPEYARSTDEVEEEDDWYGLEYTLELSTRERRASETNSEISAGECSRSRESWAAIAPYADERSYLEWCVWREYVDYQKAYAFCDKSRDDSEAYMQEIWSWDSFYWELHHYGTVSHAIKESLRNAQPDPYYPRRKKNFAWYLKRSRSVASLRELAPAPPLTA